MDLYDENDAPQFRKNIPLLEFLKMDIYDNFVLPHPLHLSADYMPKRQALVKKGKNIFKIYGHGTFEGHEYKFKDVSVTIYNRGWHKSDYTTETNPLPVHQAHHLYMNLSFYGPLTYDGVAYRSWTVPDNMKKEISDFCIALENELRQIGKAHHIGEINISGFIER
jgi:hypothetical protein